MTFPIYLPSGEVVDADNPEDRQEAYNKMMDKSTQEFNPWHQRITQSAKSEKDTTEPTYPNHH